MITFFTTAKPFLGLAAIQQRNSLQSIFASIPDAQILLFDAVEGSESICRELGIEGPLQVAYSDTGVPRIDSMFGQTAKLARNPISCFINCDILITPGFGEIVAHCHAILAKNYMLVGQRIDFECALPLFPSENWTLRLEELAAKGNLHPAHGSDYFVFATGEWHEKNLPPLLVGRAGWDNWMFFAALRAGHALVDLSPDYKVYHQNHDYSHRKVTFTDYATDPEAPANRYYLPKRDRGLHSYLLNRATHEYFTKNLRPKPLVFPGKLNHRSMAGGASAAHSGTPSTPVLLLIFCRVETTRRVIDSLRVCKPRKIYVAADNAPEGNPDLQQLCQATRAELDRIDWPCDLITNFATNNLRLADRIKSGIDWVFEKEDTVIVLEDDVLAGPEFLPFCELLLERYRYDNRIASIGGISFRPKKWTGDADYFYSRHAIYWGFATWKRAWTGFDHRAERWPEIKRAGLLAEKFKKDFLTLDTWTRIFDEAYRGKWDTWDYQWILHNWMLDRLTIHPRVNLTQNIGSDEFSTHTINPEMVETDAIAPLSLPPKAPAEMKVNAKFDAFIHAVHFEYYHRTALERKQLRLKPNLLFKKVENPSPKPDARQILRNWRQGWYLLFAWALGQDGDWDAASRKLAKAKDGSLWKDSVILLSVGQLLAQKKNAEAFKYLDQRSPRVLHNPILGILWRALRPNYLNQTVTTFHPALISEPKMRPLLDYPSETLGRWKFRIGELVFNDIDTFLDDYHAHFNEGIFRLHSAEETPRIVSYQGGEGVGVISWKRRYPGSQILVLEPNPEVYPILLTNLAKQTLVGVDHAPVALGISGGEMIYDVQSARDRAYGFAPRSYKVATVSLSDILVQPTSLLHLNLRESEAGVFANNVAVLRKVIAIVVEYESLNGSFDNLATLLEPLSQAGFQLRFESVIRRPVHQAKRLPPRAVLPSKVRIFGTRDITVN